MIRTSAAAACAALIGLGSLAVHAIAGAQGGQSPASGWTLAPDADTKKNPLGGDTRAITIGKTIYKDKCSKCHGPSGLGDGPDADPDHREDMDLTNPKRAERNPEGVVFYKVSNGRKKPKMPAFKEELTEQQVWAVVAYVQTLRKH
jgi:mono/diheme cytochrome c family protein